MIKLFFLIFSFIGVGCAFSEERLKPLFQEDKHFIYYRTLMISSAVNRIQNMMDSSRECSNEFLISLQEEIRIIRFNLGECL